MIQDVDARLQKSSFISAYLPKPLTSGVEKPETHLHISQVFWKIDPRESGYVFLFVKVLHLSSEIPLHLYSFVSDIQR